MSTNPNDPAYAHVNQHDPEKPTDVALGLSKREHFAGLAMQGVIAADSQVELTALAARDVGRLAVQMADALIAALNEGEIDDDRR